MMVNGRRWWETYTSTYTVSHPLVQLRRSVRRLGLGRGNYAFHGMKPQGAAVLSEIFHLRIKLD